MSEGEGRGESGKWGEKRGECEKRGEGRVRGERGVEKGEGGKKNFLDHSHHIAYRETYHV